MAKQFGITTKNLLLVNDLNTNAPLKVGTKLLITPVE
ncbi:LysM peptidoglycan-binding domain-containing protein [Patescibacteria group bacterium]|nr:LysM peptidoglycan-binding domain-containing protein [Patescibacteria group bacterium]